jgi:hypothetical protein
LEHNLKPFFLVAVMWQRHSGKLGKGFWRHHQTPLLGDDVRHTGLGESEERQVRSNRKKLKKKGLSIFRKI